MGIENDKYDLATTSLEGTVQVLEAPVGSDRMPESLRELSPEDLEDLTKKLRRKMDLTILLVKTGDRLPDAWADHLHYHSGRSLGFCISSIISTVKTWLLPSCKESWKIST
jgi:hypothetical protein